MTTQAARPVQWAAFVAKHGGTASGWSAQWDAATLAPRAIWGPGISAPGSIASAATAERFARSILVDEMDLLAPGGSADDFVLVSNQLDSNDPNGLRIIGFEQWHQGMRVIGGTISFRFKRDRMFAMVSTALPTIAELPVVSNPRLSKKIASLALDAASDLYQLTNATVQSANGIEILPLVTDNAILGYRVVTPITVASQQGHALAYADAQTGALVAIRGTDSWATGTVNLSIVDRNPTRPRKTFAAPRMEVTVNGSTLTTDEDGKVSWAGNAAQTLGTNARGDLVNVVTKTGTAATATLSLAAGADATWDASAVPADDAQVQAFANIVIVKRYVRTFAPALTLLDKKLLANVNIAQECNANFDGAAVNFFNASARCQNTALLSDVVFHEFGHAMHAASVIQGVGSFDGAMSEGLSDFLAASITGDAGMGRGFFFNDTALRDLDPTDSENVWPRDVGEIHKTGIIFGGAMWDLRKALIIQLGEAPGIALTNRLFYGAVQRAQDIPSTLIELLVSDDDNGNLADGTPHECTIRAAFGRHGLRTMVGESNAPSALNLPATTAVGVNFTLRGLSTLCSGDTVDNVTVFWKGKSGIPEANSMVATPLNRLDNGAGIWSAQVPLAHNGLVDFKADIKFVDGTIASLPDNPGDPVYTMFEGQTVQLYCTDFERDPFAEGWQATTGAAATAFEWGDPKSAISKSATDPKAAFSGSRILAQGLGKDYSPNSTAAVTSPLIDIGRYSAVRLQYRRWLAVEDGHFDKARILANGKVAWNNFDSNKGDSSSVHTVDREWRYADVPLSKFIRNHQLQLTFDMTSDPGLHLGGWQLDDVCIVADPSSVCGDGVKSGAEQCDDGANNADTSGACRTDCFVATCGDGIVDDGEECDGGSDTSGACTDKCISNISVGGGGLCSSGGGAGMSYLVGALLVGFACVRRRRGAW
jgi:hypothetical protein